MNEGTAQTSGSTNSAPDWAQRLRSEQSARNSRHTVAQAIKDGDKSGAAANPSLHDKED